GWNESLIWSVFDQTGKQLDGSQKPTPSLVHQKESAGGENGDKEDLTWNGDAWRIARRELRADENRGRSRSKGVPPEEETATKRYSRLTLAVGTPLGHFTNQLRLLAIALA